MIPERIDSLSRGQWSALSGGLEIQRGDRIKSVKQFRSLLEPQSVVRKRHRVAALLAILAIIIIVPVSLNFYERAVEQRTMDDRGRLQAPFVTTPAVRPALTAEQQDEIDALISLARYQFASVSDEMSADDLIYFLSDGPNNVTQLADAVLQVDPGYEAALELRQRVFEVFLAKARALEGEEAYQQAITLTRTAEAVIPNTSTVFRLQRSICKSAPAACARQ